MSNAQALLDSLEDAAEQIKGLRDKRFAFLTHYDADGLSSGGVMLRAAASMNLDFSFRTTADLTARDFEDFLAITADVFVLTDLGTGHLDTITENIGDDQRVVILDHHQLKADEPDSDRILLVNPELHGIDGGQYGCAAVLASLLGFSLSDGEDPYHLKLGVVGMVADMQDGDEGINRHLVELAEEQGVVEARTDLVFFRLPNTPVHKAISWTDTPYIPELSGHEDTAVTLLSSRDIPLRVEDRWRTVSELTAEERGSIVDAIIEHAASKGGKIESSELVQTTYVFPDEEETYLGVAQEFGSVLNACGRMGRMDLGLILAAGDRDDVLPEINRLVEEKRAKVATMLEKAREALVERDGVVVVDGRKFIDENFAGTVSTVLSKSPVYRENVVLVFTSTSNGDLKVSSRAPVPLTEKGYNLGDILADVAGGLGGEGGGHTMAAGATIPSENADDGIERVTESCVSELSTVEA